MGMNDFDRTWHVGVEVILEDDVEEYHLVSSTREAALFLIESWPARRGRAYARALKACLDVIADEEGEEEARTAFVAAVEEARIDVRRH
ncbi:DUF982 domain-containing protein [Rhizobium sp. RAF56]|jgi:hypothetical protein|uniref:DUF982 domain-containing protein n=1 Tax=Rhizobium sp. RAF56 TaxID=3233062 RepID=UPI003F9EA02B